MATIQDLCAHFRVRKTAMTDYVKRHLDEINDDGKQHARMAKGCWQFDDIAVKRIEDLRGFGLAGVMEKVESDEIKELKVTIDNLQVALLQAQQKAMTASDQLAESERNQRLLIEQKGKESVEMSSELATLRERTKHQEEDVANLRREVEDERAKRKAAEEERDRRIEEVATMQKAGFFRRLFGRF